MKTLPTKAAILLQGILTASALSVGDVRPTVVVAGATGKAGSAVVRSLVESGGVDVVALVRSAERARALYGDGSGVAIAEADYSDTDALDAVLCQHPACRLFIACANGPQQARLEINLCEAAVRHGAAYAVKLSTVTPVLEMKVGGPYGAHLESEAALAASGLPFTVLRPNLFMHMLAGDGFLGLGLDEQGKSEHPFATARVSMIDVRDVGACAAALLAQPGSPAESAHNGATYDLSGPAAVAVGDELASAVSALHPQPIHVAPCTATELLTRRMPGLPAPLATNLEGFLAVLGGECSEVTDTVERLCGRPATSVEQFVNEHASEFLPASYRRLLGRAAGSFGEGAEVVTLPLAAELEALGEGELLIRVLVAGVNGGADTFSVTRAAPDAKDLKLGAEGVGVVVACGGGAEVAQFAVGEQVLFLGGGYSEYVRLGAKACFAPPPAAATTAVVDPAELVALRISGLTAATALGRTATISKGDVVVVTACCGATGSFAVQEAVARGATVVGTVGSEEKAAAARALGVSRVVNYKAEKLGAVLAAEFPQGVAVAYEGVGGALLKDVVDNLAEDGTVLLVGSISQYPHNAEVEPHGIEGVADAMDIFRAGETVDLGEGRSIVGNVWGDAFSALELDGQRTLTAVRDNVYERHGRGELTALVDDVRPGAPRFVGVEQAAAAVAHMLAGRNVGKVVVRVAWDSTPAANP